MIKSKHLRLARSSFAIPSRIPSDHSESLAEVRKRLRRLGIKTRTKIPARTKWARLSTALPWCVLQASHWDRLSLADRAEILWHEYAHALQQRAHRVSFFIRYASAEWRWAYEVQAYRVSLIAMKRHGVTRHARERAIDRIASMLPKTYKLGRLNVRRLRRLTIEILRREL